MAYCADGTDKEHPDRPQKFTCKKHANKILNAMNSIRKKRHFCDGCVVIDGKEIPIQKGVLAAASHYFRLVFDKENDCKSSVSDPTIQGVDLSSSVVDLSPLQITVDTFEIILNYLYTSEIVLDEENIQNILQAADLLLLAELKQACCEYLLKCITPQNCLGIWDFASRFNCSWVRLKTTQYIENNFRDLCLCVEFLQLPLDTLTSLLSIDTLQVRSEEDILHSMIRWLKHDEEKRVSQLPDLINKCLRVHQLHDDTLKNLNPDICNLRITEIIQDKVRSESGCVEKMRGMTCLLVSAGGDTKVLQ